VLCVCFDFTDCKKKPFLVTVSWFLKQKKQRGQLPTAVEVRPRTRLTSNATTTLWRGVLHTILSDI